MVDILYKAAVNYKKMLNIGYKIILGKKGKAYYINLNFYEESFFHLVGLQHLWPIGCVYTLILRKQRKMNIV